LGRNKLKELTEQDKQECLQGRGNKCPYCKSVDIVLCWHEDLEWRWEDGEIRAKIHCDNCDAVWHLIYSLTGIETA
jgi:hypothetical protein